MLADDVTEVPFETVRVSLDTIASGGPGTTSPTILTPVADVVLTGTEKYHILVNSQDVGHTITVADGQTAEIQNISNAAEDLVVISNGNANQTLTPGQSAIFRWNASTDDHEITLGTSVSVDAAMSDASANPVQNQVVKDYIDTETVLVDNVQTTIGTSVHPPTTTAIKAYVDKRNYVRAGDYVLTQSAGDLATRISADDTAWNTAVAALNSQGYGTLWIDGEITLNAAKVFTKPISLRGLTTDAAIRVTHANAQLAWGSYWDAIVSGTGEAAFTLTNTVAWQELITVTGSTWNQGQWLALWSSNELSGMVKNLTHQYPMEVHQILRAQGSGVYHLGDACVDALSTTPKARLIPMLNKPLGQSSDVVISDLVFRQEASIVNIRLFDIRCLNGVTVENNTWELNSTAGAPGDILFNFCSNVKFLGNRNHGTERYDTDAQGYWFLAAAVNGCIATHNFSRRCRHSFDTAGATQGGTADSRWGTPRHLLITKNVVHVEGNPSTVGNLIAMSTHGEGWGVTFSDNDIYVSEHAAAVNGGITVRSRHGQVIGNRFWGGGLAKGVNIYGSDCTVAGNEFHNMWQAIQFEDFYLATMGQFDRGLIRNNEFHNCNGSIGTIWIEATDDTVIEGNLFLNCNSGGVYADINSGTVDNLQIIGNVFDGCPVSGSYHAIQAVDAITNWKIIDNTFIDCDNDVIEFAGDVVGHQIIDNKFINCAGSETLITFTGGGGSSAGVRVAKNDAPLGINADFIALGSLDDADIKIIGNIADGYGSGDLGLTGTNAAAINTSQAGNNWTD